MGEQRGNEAFDRRLMPAMILGALLNPVNSSILAVSLVPIGSAFHAPSSQTAWLVSALYLATAIGQPVVGRLVDTFGPRRLFLAGASLTGIAGVIGTLAPSLPVLIVARVILGFGTCSGYPAAMYLIKSESRRTGKDSPGAVLTALAISSQTIVVIGPPLGGLLIGAAGWRATLAVNIPLSIACLVLGARTLPRHTAVVDGAVVGEGDHAGAAADGGATTSARAALAQIDVAGIALFAGMLTSLLLFLMTPKVDDLWLLLVTAAAAGGLVARERRAADPFIDLAVFGGNGPLLRTYLRTLLAMTVSYSFLYGFTQWLQDGRSLTAAQAGLVLLPLSLVAIAVSSATGRRKELRGKLLVGAAAQLVGCAALLTLHAGSPIWLILLIIAIVGVPQGLLSLANQNAIYYQADAARMGSSAGLLRTFAYLGAIVASAATGGFFGERADTAGLHHLAIMLVVIGVLLFALTLFDRPLGRVGRGDEEADPVGRRPAKPLQPRANPARS